MLLSALMLSRISMAAEIYEDFPRSIRPAEKYVIYSHGLIVEGAEQKPVHPEYGVYDFPAIKLALLAKGQFNVIAPHRPKSTDGDAYAGSLVTGVLKLIRSGVDPRNITLVGFSRGAQLTLQASSLLRNRGINTVLLAVCSSGDFAAAPPTDLGGRLLSIYEVTDVVGSCAGLAGRSHLLSFEELAISTGRKHGAFYQPLQEWVDPVLDWIQRQSRQIP